MIRDKANIDKTFREINQIKEDKKAYDEAANETIKRKFESLLFGSEKQVKEGIGGVKNAFTIWKMDEEERQKHNESFNGCLNQLGFEFGESMIIGGGRVRAMTPLPD